MRSDLLGDEAGFAECDEHGLYPVENAQCPICLAIANEESIDNEATEPCGLCNGNGGYDASTDCEVYDDWQECPDCEGTGESQGDIFIPKRDAWKAGD